MSIKIIKAFSELTQVCLGPECLGSAPHLQHDNLLARQQSQNLPLFSPIQLRDSSNSSSVMNRGTVPSAKKACKAN